MRRSWRRPASRRFNLLVLVLLLAAVALLVVALGPIRPAPSPVPELTTVVGAADCEGAPETSPAVVTSTTLLTCPEVFQERRVQVEGEAIGDLFDGPDGRRWVQINDDAYARVGPLTSHFQTLGTNSGVAVLLPPGQDPQVLGGPGRRGDLLRVVGLFDATAPEDQGGVAVVADTVEVIDRGAYVPTIPSTRLRVVTPVAVVVTVVLLLSVQRRRVHR